MGVIGPEAVRCQREERVRALAAITVRLITIEVDKVRVGTVEK